MRKTALSALGLVAVLAVPASAAGTPGPFAGLVRQGETKTHAFDNYGAADACPHVMTTYAVSLRYLPITDTLTLTVNGVNIRGLNGGASATVTASFCTRFPVSVTGTAVSDVAAYTVTVTRSSGSSGTATS